MSLIDDLSGGVRISMGRNPIVGYNSVYGYNPDVDATADPEDVWNGGGLYTGFPEETETLTVVSSSASDTANGTGARTVRLYGRNASGASQTELVTLNGTTPVETSRTWSRMSFARVRSAGTGTTNIGELTIRHSSTTDNIFAVMPAGVSRTNIAAYTVPIDRRAAFIAYRASVSNNSGAGTAARVRVSVMTREPGTNVWEQRRSIWATNVAGVSEVKLDGAVMLAPGTDIVMRCLPGASSNNLALTGSFAVFTVPLD
jgi:hypothetical protein